MSTSDGIASNVPTQRRTASSPLAGLPTAGQIVSGCGNTRPANRSRLIRARFDIEVILPQPCRAADNESIDIAARNTVGLGDHLIERGSSEAAGPWAEWSSRRGPRGDAIGSNRQVACRNDGRVSAHTQPASSPSGGGIDPLLMLFDRRDVEPKLRSRFLRRDSGDGQRKDKRHGDFHMETCYKQKLPTWTNQVGSWKLAVGSFC